MPVPYLDNREASRHLEFVAARTELEDLTSFERSLRSSWLRLQRISRATISASDGSGRALAAAQQRMRMECNRTTNEGGVKRVSVVGDGVALSLARAVARLELEPHEAGDEARRWGGTFINKARQVDLIDSGRRLKVHPIVPFVLTQMSWRVACGLPVESGLGSVELDAVDVFKIRFGHKLSVGERLRSVDRFARRHHEFRGEIALSVLFLSAQQPDQAALVLRQAAVAHPKNRALRNNLLYAEAALY